MLGKQYSSPPAMDTNAPAQRYRRQRLAARCTDVADPNDRTPTTPSPLRDEGGAGFSFRFEDCFEQGGTMSSGSFYASTSTCSSGTSRSTSPVTAVTATAIQTTPRHARMALTKEERRRGRKGRMVRSRSHRRRHCRKRTSLPCSAQEYSPCSVINLAASGVSSDPSLSLSLDQIIARESAKGPASAMASFETLFGLAGDESMAPPQPQPQKVLDFSAFDNLTSGPLDNTRASMAAAISAVLAANCDDGREHHGRVVEHLLNLLEKSRHDVLSSAINAVEYNKVVCHLVQNCEYTLASRVLGMMVSDGVQLTTLSDEWVLHGRLTAAVSLVQTLVNKGALLSPSTLDALFISWLSMGIAGLKAAQDMETLFCKIHHTLSRKRALHLVSKLVGSSTRFPCNGKAMEKPCMSNESSSSSSMVSSTDNMLALEALLSQIFLTREVQFEPGAIVEMLYFLEKGMEGKSKHAASRRHLCEHIRHLYKRSSRSLCADCTAVFLRVSLCEGRFEDAQSILDSLQPVDPAVAQRSRGSQADLLLLTSVLHSTASAGAACPQNWVAEIEFDDNDSAQQLLEVCRKLCQLCAALPHAPIKYSVLNQALNTLRACEPCTKASGSTSACRSSQRVTSAMVGVTLFEGLCSLHSKAVNWRTYDRLLQLLLSAATDQAREQPEIVASLQRVYAAAEDFGYVPSQYVASQLRQQGLGCTLVVPPKRSAAIDISLEVRKSPQCRDGNESSASSACSSVQSVDLASHSANQPHRIAFSLLNDSCVREDLAAHPIG